MEAHNTPNPKPKNIVVGMVAQGPEQACPCRKAAVCLAVLPQLVQLSPTCLSQAMVCARGLALSLLAQTPSTRQKMRKQTKQSSIW